MKYIKEFEITTYYDDTYYINSQIELKDKLTWVIYGDFYEQKEVIKSLMKGTSDLIQHDLIKVIAHLEKDSIGIVLCYTTRNLFGLFIFKDYAKKDYAIKEYYFDFEFKGELKIENDKLILDPTEADTNKYNL